MNEVGSCCFPDRGEQGTTLRMSRLICCELKKALTRRWVWLVLILLLSANTLHVWSQARKDAADLSDADVVQTENTFDGFSDYEEYLNYIDAQVASLSSFSLFENNSAYSMRRMEQMQRVYHKLEGTLLQQDVSEGVLLVTDFRLTDVFLFAGAVLFALVIMISEREDGQIYLLKPTRFGYRRLIFVKMLVLAVLSGGLAAAFFGTNLLVGAAIYGLGDGMRSLQSLSGYIGCPFSISVGFYLLVFFLCRMFVSAVLALLAGMICIFFRTSFSAVFVCCFVFGGEAIVYWKVADTSWLYGLKELNLCALLDVGHYFADYKTLNLLDNPVFIAVPAAVLTVVGALVAICSSCCVWCRETQVAGARFVSAHFSKGKRTFSKLGIPFRVHVNLWRHEAFKIWKSNCGFLLLVILCAVQIFSSREDFYYQTPQDYYYQNYAEELTGELTEEKEQYLATEQALVDQGVYSSDRETAFYQVLNQYERLQEAKSQGKKVQFISQTGWNLLIGIQGYRQLALGILKFFAVVIPTLAGLFAQERKTGVQTLIDVSARGARAVGFCKTVLSIGYAQAAALLSFVPFAVRVIRRFSLMEMAAAPACSILTLGAFPAVISIRGLLVFWVALLLFLSGLAACVILMFSCNIARTMAVAMLSVVLFVLPALAVAVYLYSQ